LFRCSSSGYATAWPHNSANAKDSSPTYSIHLLLTCAAFFDLHDEGVHGSFAVFALILCRQ
jgi:hypothetical protein